MSSSSEPALTPMRIAQPTSPAASITASTFSQLPMLPGLMRSFAAPARTAPIARRWSKWMSATIGTGEEAHTSRKPSSAAAVGTETRTRSQPACASARTCSRVAAASAVGVQVMDCTATGAPPPMRTPPTLTARVRARAQRTSIDSIEVTSP